MRAELSPKIVPRSLSPAEGPVLNTTDICVGKITSEWLQIERAHCMIHLKISSKSEPYFKICIFIFIQNSDSSTRDK